MAALTNAHAVILAGGTGTRFWPASTPSRPKQLLPLAGPPSLLEQTLHRAVRLVGPSRVHVVTSESLAAAVRETPSGASVDVLCEPRARGTGPALVWAAFELERRDPGAFMISMHSDHRIEPLEELERTLVRALEVADDGYLVCVSARPTRPETGYGYLRPGAELGEWARVVDSFVEKPDEATAAAYLASGDYLWNAGIFAWRCRDLLAEARDRAPEIPLHLLETEGREAFFERTAKIAIDLAVIERAPRVATVEATFEWDDVGVWNALARTRPSDAAGNAIVGRARAHEARNNIVWTESVRANLIGVSDLVVVEAGGELLVMPRDRAARLDDLRRALEANESGARAGGAGEDG